MFFIENGRNSVLPSFRPKKSKLGYFRWDFNSSSTEAICRKNRTSQLSPDGFGGLFGPETSEQEGILFG